MSGPAESIVVGPGPLVCDLGITNVGELLGRTASGAMSGVPMLGVNKAILAALVPENNATLIWTTQPGCRVGYAAAKQQITLPDVGDVTSWPAGEARPLVIGNTGGFGVGFVALPGAGFNLAAVNNAIVTLTGSNVVPGLAVNVPAYTIYRVSASSYLIWVGV